MAFKKKKLDEITFRLCEIAKFFFLKAIGSPGKKCGLRPTNASKRFEVFTADYTKGSRKNNLRFSHPIFGPSLNDPQSQNPQISRASPAVLLNRIVQTRIKSGREQCELIFARALSSGQPLKSP